MQGNSIKGIPEKLTEAAFYPSGDLSAAIMPYSDVLADIRIFLTVILVIAGILVCLLSINRLINFRHFHKNIALSFLPISLYVCFLGIIDIICSVTLLLSDTIQSS